MDGGIVGLFIAVLVCTGIMFLGLGALMDNGAWENKVISGKEFRIDDSLYQCKKNYEMRSITP